MIRVLVVDDDFMVARLHSTLVEREPGFAVAGVAHSGAEALTAVRELAPDLVLLDIYLPDIPGLEVLRELRGGGAPEGGPDVLVVTAARDAGTVRGAQRGGAVQYIIKPFEGQLLQERLRQYAERRKELAALAAPGQDDVDRLFGGAGGAGGALGAGATQGHGGGRTPASLPKGLTEQTAALVRDALDAGVEGEGVSASECAERSGLSRVSARRYLEHFVATGSARVTLRYGTTGRPERRYHREGRPPAPAHGPGAPGTERHGSA
ncbi:response regulator [Streptomyces sp. NPDC054796]